MEDKTKHIKRIHTTCDNPPFIPSSDSSCKAVHPPTIGLDPLGTKEDKNVFTRCMKRMTRCLRPVKTNRGPNFDRNTFSTDQNYEQSLCITECPKGASRNETYFPQNGPSKKRSTEEDSSSKETMSGVTSCVRREKKVIVQQSNSQRTTEDLQNGKSSCDGSGVEQLDMFLNKSIPLSNMSRIKTTSFRGDVTNVKTTHFEGDVTTLNKSSCLDDMALKVLSIDEEKEISSAASSYNHSFESENIKDEDNLENDLRLGM